MLMGWFSIYSFQKRIADCRLWPVEITRVPLITVPKGKPGKLEKVNKCIPQIKPVRRLLPMAPSNWGTETMAIFAPEVESSLGNRETSSQVLKVRSVQSN